MLFKIGSVHGRKLAWWKIFCKKCLQSAKSFAILPSFAHAAFHREAFGERWKMEQQAQPAPEFTATQIADWKAYERVRKGGRFNMFDPRARQATKLDGERYKFVMRNYSALRDAATTASQA